MRKVKFLFKCLSITLLLASCSDENLTSDESRSNENVTNNALFSSSSASYSVNSIERVVNFSDFFISNIQGSNGIYVYTLDSLGIQKNIDIEKTENELKIIDNDAHRSLVFNRVDETITYYENLVEVDITNEYIDDLVYVYYQYSVVNNNPNAAKSNNSLSIGSTIHTAISIQWRKSIAVENCQRLIDDYLAENPDCHQLGGIDTWCSFGDFGCIAIGEIEC
ncbi:hypothetical protein [Paenimyroides aestuarii]|uniref:Lipoprotein n=1 Tax=Paenimyroides aestuarii TaxID=2968490 RepID=A0ABY5NNL5_9FLAO|nr:hypothetical protein [Paenimyroides aestuarii]UUV20131.1 hypothetical protein NPX36_07065 [Paenimyroides aestuarii]